MNNKIAILIFANSAEKEIISKSFSTKSVFETLNKQTIKIAEKTGLPYFLHSERQQIGDTFGERITNAIQSIYNKGFNTVITIGNDTPHLTSAHILKTVDTLKTHKLVLGPSLDGGFYLMGIKKSCFNTKTFVNLPWQTSKLNRSLNTLVTASKKETISYLEPLKDIDEQADISIVINTKRELTKTIKKLLVKLILLNKLIFTDYKTALQTHFCNQHLNKGSPIYA